MTDRQPGYHQPGLGSLPNDPQEFGYTNECDVPTSAALTTGWDHSQCPTPHRAHTSRNPSIDSLPHGKKSDDKEQQSHSPAHGKLGIRDRIQHLTWAWFTTTMSTGGLALALGQTPHQFAGLRTIGKIVFILDLVLFVTLVLSIVTRFVLCPRALKASLTDATEAFFFPTFWLSISTIISNTQVYGTPATGPWLETALRVVFWTYAACTILVAVVLYLVLFSTPSVHTKCGPSTAAPSWILPVFPVMLCGTLSGLLAPHQSSPTHALAMIVAGVSFQGLGWTVYTAVMALFLLRLLHAGLLPPGERAAMFMMVGPPSFTALALVANANALPAAHHYFAVAHPGARDMLLVLATWAAVFLWSLAFWFFGLALGACLMVVPRVRWTPMWWAYVFPNVGFTIATVEVGKELDSEGILWVASGMTVALVAMWLFIAVAQVRAVAKKMVLWPGKDEDRNEPHVSEMLKGYPK
ncbi:c4-dicarboxylate transporter malic acid transport protein [Diplodia corticola]|uniref:C4-dicarboxylate transporter malic acid transport protein n=1 Tax=Diplodia corticola TaxID=236234 RepID=A0A1J9SL78_9PEZI|nr:c4-dicarboxylate transporter malic acid transport protein [Diplodia corticola]OJD40373.1 c4-dicarboxylate transporter malic acid transport protein [Diplodia corticola]